MAREIRCSDTVTPAEPIVNGQRLVVRRSFSEDLPHEVVKILTDFNGQQRGVSGSSTRPPIRPLTLNAERWWAGSSPAGDATVDEWPCVVLHAAKSHLHASSEEIGGDRRDN